ncbi:MAG: flagellar type III secretion system pore protein FliP [Opitutales bacterium]|nr:flagellar type III secretion system pore protein FliP [Opitutales bacterium]
MSHSLKAFFALTILTFVGMVFPVSAAAQQVPAPTTAAPATPVTMQVQFNSAEGEDFGVAIQLLVFMTILTLAPSIVMMMTSFTRIVIVLGFVGKAVGTQGVPSSQIIVGLSLFLTFFVMGPTWNHVYEDAVTPYMAKEMTSIEALDVASGHMSDFMLRQTRSQDVEFFLGLAGEGPTAVVDLPMRVVIPSFVTSELRTAFQMGFLIYVPFLIVDFLIASTLMSMGMMMMPPVIISAPFKILLFVLVDGWTLVIQSLISSFNY